MKSIEFFKQALEKDPNYALAYSGLADSYSLLGEASFLPPKESFQNARIYAEKALKLDEALSEAHLSLGIVKLFYDWDVPGAARELLRAKELDSHNVQVYHFNGHRLEFESRFEEAIAEFERGVDVDPTNLIINTELANGQLNGTPLRPELRDRIGVACASIRTKRNVPGGSNGIE